MEYISGIIQKLGPENIGYYGHLEPSDKYTQGIDVKINGNIDEHAYKGPAVYFLTEYHPSWYHLGMIHKIGQTGNLHDRMYRQYKCVVNTTNNRIREHIRTKGKLGIWYVPLEEHEISKFGYNLKTSYSSALEYHLLKEYKKIYDKLPELNTMIK